MKTNDVLDEGLCQSREEILSCVNINISWNLNHTNQLFSLLWIRETFWVGAYSMDLMYSIQYIDFGTWLLLFYNVVVYLAWKVR